MSMCYGTVVTYHLFVLDNWDYHVLYCSPNVRYVGRIARRVLGAAGRDETIRLSCKICVNSDTTPPLQGYPDLCVTNFRTHTSQSHDLQV